MQAIVYGKKKDALAGILKQIGFSVLIFNVQEFSCDLLTIHP